MRANSTLKRSLVTCEPVIAEALHMLRQIPGAGLAVLASLEEGILEIPLSLTDSVSKVAELIEKYSDTPADLADACLIHMADALDTGDILTLDSDFLHYRWRKNRAFNLLIS
jgi:predicted nucleic acid-binding protein